MPCPIITCTQAGSANSSSPSRRNRPFARNSAIRAARLSGRAPRGARPRRARPRIGMVMQDQEIADRQPFGRRLAVIGVDLDRLGRLAGPIVEQSRDARLDQMDAGRLQWFQKSGRSPSATQLPTQARPRRPVVKRNCAARPSPRRSARTAGGRWLRRPRDGGCHNQAVAGAVLKRNAPAPARTMRDGAGIGGQGAGPLARHRQRAVAGEQLGPVVERLGQRLADQQRAKPVQSMNRSPACLSAAIEHDMIDPPARVARDRGDAPSTRTTPAVSAWRRSSAA